MAGGTPVLGVPLAGLEYPLARTGVPPRKDLGTETGVTPPFKGPGTRVWEGTGSMTVVPPPTRKDMEPETVKGSGTRDLDPFPSQSTDKVKTLPSIVLRTRAVTRHTTTASHPNGHTRPALGGGGDRVAYSLGWG